MSQGGLWERGIILKVQSDDIAWDRLTRWWFDELAKVV